MTSGSYETFFVHSLYRTAQNNRKINQMSLILLREMAMTEKELLCGEKSHTHTLREPFGGEEGRGRRKKKRGQS